MTTTGIHSEQDGRRACTVRFGRLALITTLSAICAGGFVQAEDAPVYKPCLATPPDDRTGSYEATFVAFYEAAFLAEGWSRVSDPAVHEAAAAKLGEMEFLSANGMPAFEDADALEGFMAEAQAYGRDAFFDDPLFQRGDTIAAVKVLGVLEPLMVSCLFSDRELHDVDLAISQDPDSSTVNHMTSAKVPLGTFALPGWDLAVLAMRYVPPFEAKLPIYQQDSITVILDIAENP